MKTFLTLFTLILTLTVSCFADPVKDDSATDTMFVALVFDDGPRPDLNAQFLQKFEELGIHVTFAQEAKRAEANPELSAAVLNAGHEIANHSYEHKHPKELDDEALHKEIVGAEKIFTEILGQSPAWYWPPFLERDPRMPALFKEAGIQIYEPVNLVVSVDYDNSVGAEDIYKNATTGVTDGSVILFHEWRQETLDQIEAIVANLRAQGCSFLTYSELYEYTSNN